MDGFVAEDKYQKLRAQASVLRKAFLEEQSKCSGLRDQLKQKETTIRRSEQEIDSLGFRNDQLEHRVAVLQTELATSETRKKDKENKKRGAIDKHETQQVHFTDVSTAQDAIIFEELQKKIMENAELTSSIDDKERSLQLHVEHIKNMEETMDKRNLEHANVEKRLRKDVEMLQCRNQELETKLVEAASMLGSEDALSVSGSENTPLNNHQHTHLATTENRIHTLEQQVAHWRSQYELSKLYADSFHLVDEKISSPENKSNPKDLTCSSTTTAAGLTIIPSFSDGKSKRDSGKDHLMPCSKELLLFNNLSKKFEDLLKEKVWAESKVGSVETEVDHLQNCLENATQELKNKDDQIESINQTLHLLEEELTTTKVNYDDQISVMTEQIISLSEQLAASK